MSEFIQWIRVNHETGEQGYGRIGKLYVYLIEEWSQFGKPCNWWTFHPWQCELERDDTASDYGLIFIVMGLGFRLSLPQRQLTPQGQDIRERADEWYQQLMAEREPREEVRY